MSTLAIIAAALAIFIAGMAVGVSVTTWLCSRNESKPR